MSVNPIKMYEYLSAGKPIISTPLPEVTQYRQIIEIADTPEEFIQTILKVMDSSSDSNSPEKIASRQSIGKENSWDARWEKVLTYIN